MDAAAPKSALSVPAAETTPLASIVVRTCRGRGELLAECLRSLAAQTYRPLEAVVVEDGSDANRSTAEAVAGQTGLRMTYRSIAKRGRCRAGNVGLAAAAGRFLGFLDDDDQFLPQHVELLAAALARQPSAPAAYGLAFEVPTRMLGREPLRYVEAGRYVVHRRAFEPSELASRNFLPIQAVLFRRELFERFGGLDESLENLEDWDLWIRYQAAGVFTCVPQVTSFHRVPARAAEALARYRQMQAYRPIFLARRKLQTDTLRPTWRTLAQKLIARRPLFDAYWNARRVYYAWRGPPSRAA